MKNSPPRGMSRKTAMLDKGMAFIDGAYVEPSNAKISIFDLGFTKSDVVYDVTSVWKGLFFRIDDHIERFLASCEGVGMRCPYGPGEIRRILGNCVHRGDVADNAYVEVALTRGAYKSYIDDFTPDLRDTHVNFIAFAIPYVWIAPPEAQATGIDIIIAKTRRIPDESVDARFKNFHWGDLTRARIEATDAGAHNAVLCTPDGYLAEGPGFNIFFVKDGVLHTPKRNMLEGITRRTVGDLAGEIDASVVTGDYLPEALLEADEAFACSTAGGIMPVVKVDDRIISNGKPGELSAALRRLYWRKREAGWLGVPIADLIAES